MPALDPASVRSVTVLWLGRIGDLIVSTAFLKALRRRFPGARVRLVTDAACAQAAALIPSIDETVLSHRLKNPLASLKLAARLLTPCDLLVDLNPSFSRLSAALAAAARAPVKLGFSKGRWDGVYTDAVGPAGEREHMLERYRRLAQALDAPYDGEPELRVPPAEEALSASVLAGLRPPMKPGALTLLIHPGNFKKFENRWPEEKFARLTEALQEDPDVSLLYLAGPGEESHVRQILGLLRRPIPLLPRASLGVTAAVMRRMDLCVLNITGTTHLAAAVGARTFGFYCGYTDAVWRPRGPRHAGVTADSWESCRGISVEAALSALKAIITQLKAARPGAPS